MSLLLTEVQQTSLKNWLAAGDRLSVIQDRVRETWGISLTYLQLRCLLDDLHLVPPETPKPESKIERAKQAEPQALSAPVDPTVAGVRVNLDPLAQPGAVCSGDVVFSDGQHAKWTIDYMGRLGLIPGMAGYNPSQSDLAAFQSELRALLANAGF